MKLDGREINRILGQNIRQKRKQAGLSQKDLADAVSELSDCIVYASMVSSWERGDSFVPDLRRAALFVIRAVPAQRYCKRPRHRSPHNCQNHVAACKGNSSLYGS